MENSKKRLFIIAGFVAMLALLITNGVITRHQLDLQMQDQSWVAHTEQVRYQLSELDLLLKNAETGQRGFLFTGDSKYLEPYQDSLGQITGSLDQLSQLTADNTEQQKRLAELRVTVQQKLEELARTITFYQSGEFDRAKQLVLSDAGRLYMEQIDQNIAAMLKIEEGLQDRRLSVYRSSTRLTQASIMVASVVAAIGLVLLAYYILREMNLRERFSQEMADREQWFRVTLSSLGDAVIATDPAGKIMYLNPVAEKLTGWSVADSRGRSIQEVFPIFNEYTEQVVENPVEKVLAQGGVVGLANHTVLRHKSGLLTPIEDSAAPIYDDQSHLLGVALVFRDATQERKSQELLRRTEKLSAAARLAATFAHEINNPLAAVVNLVYIVKNMEGLPEMAIQPLEMAEQELDRVSHITRQTLGFYRETSVRGQVDLPAVVESVLRLYANKLKAKNLKIAKEFEKVQPVPGLAGELTQVVSNLVSNAADALGLDGVIHIRINMTEQNQVPAVRLEIEDNGPGIDAKLKERIFEPFFTTKADIGTGLGLWVSREIVDRHRGTLEVISPVTHSGGARFVMVVPALDTNPLATTTLAKEES